jgi:hypothetical protein
MIRSRTIFLHACVRCVKMIHMLCEVLRFKDSRIKITEILLPLCSSTHTTFTRCLHSITECWILSFAHVPNTLMFCHCHFLSCHTIMTEQTLIHNLRSWAPWTTTTVCAGNIRHHHSQNQTLQRRSRQFGGEIMFPESWTQVNACMHLHELEIKNCILSYSAIEKFPAMWQEMWAACCWCSYHSFCQAVPAKEKFPEMLWEEICYLLLMLSNP